MKIDIDEVLRLRAPGVWRILPRFMIRGLEKFICQGRLNELLAGNASLSGADFAEGVLRDLSVTYRIRGDFDPSQRRVIFVSNHPLGGLDGLVLASAVKQLYLGDGEMKFVVNDLLTFVEPLRSIFLGINKHGDQSRDAVALLDQAFAGQAPIVMFPAGLVSRRQPDGSIADLRWQKMVVNKAISCQRDIIPLHFSGENSKFFYNFAHLRTSLGLKFNIEMARLPAEIFQREGETFTITLGSPVRWQSLKGGRDAQRQADELRETVYSLRP